MKLLRNSLFLLFVLALTSGCSDEVESVRLNNEGVEALKKKNPALAERRFLQSLKKRPLNGDVKLNLGLTFEIGKQPDKALKEYESVLVSAKENPEQLLAALINTANILAQKKQIDRALSLYQKALSLAPGSQEIKQNIELIWQQKSGGGGGGDKNKKPQNDKNGKGQAPKNKPQPKKFKSKELTKNDVRRILEELKNQEQKIRAKETKKNLKEPPREKNW